MKRALLVAIVALGAMLPPVGAAAQEARGSEGNPFELPGKSDVDLQSRVGFELSKEWGDFRLGLEEELRLSDLDGASHVFDRVHSTLGASYRPLSWFRVGLNYTFIAIDHDGNAASDEKRYWDLRHRVSADFLFTLRAGQWRFSLRERGQFTNRTGEVDTREMPRWEAILRHRVKVDYELYHLPLRPYVSTEISNTLNMPAATGQYLDKVRSMVGIEWRLDRRSTLDFFLRFDYTFNRDLTVDNTPPQYFVAPEKGYNFIVGVFYMYSF